ncbi:hypothetical protein HBI38_181930 [Parastagonospora nodorum]|nr:hypothetical protein HBH51_177160 [Parastagonospora nodorum]KAH4019317.1 hypothetical protein HBI09_187910 [Parastagonospora nodorum]KAH4087205.1 hypothetical protein HBH46_200800 [Parastagonospora nodorum]KAH4183504.1 hypothetical protein HBH42_205480 [Parastagonospora nodorum]KAH4606584.1 hypothetical protein HBH82_109860 [Parastagonospora nodorum]
MSGILNNEERVRSGRNRNRGRGRQSNNHPGAASMYATGNNAGNMSSFAPPINRSGYGNAGPIYTGNQGMYAYSNDARVNTGYNMMNHNIQRNGNVPSAFNNAGANGMRTQGSNMTVNSGFNITASNMNDNGNAYGGSNSSAMVHAGYDNAANPPLASTRAFINDASGNGTSSPAMTGLQRRQSLRDSSVRDAGSARIQYGPVGGSLSAPFQAAPVAMAAAASDAAARAIITAGPITVSIASERERPGANVASPAFIHGFVVTPANYNLWSNVLLPHITLFTFEVSSSSDLHFLANMLSCRQLPLLHQAVTHVTFPGFYWFSGVAHNRRENPYFVLTKTLVGLQDISLRFHTAGITTSRFGERQMLAIEAVEPERAKERKVMRLDDVVDKYGLGGIFACPQLRRIRVEFIDCPRTRYFTRVGDAVLLLREIQMWLVTGCAQEGLNVLVELEQVQ